MRGGRTRGRGAGRERKRYGAKRKGVEGRRPRKRLTKLFHLLRRDSVGLVQCWQRDRAIPLPPPLRPREPHHDHQPDPLHGPPTPRPRAPHPPRPPTGSSRAATPPRRSADPALRGRGVRLLLSPQPEGRKPLCYRPASRGEGRVSRPKLNPRLFILEGGSVWRFSRGGAAQCGISLGGGGQSSVAFLLEGGGWPTRCGTAQCGVSLGGPEVRGAGDSLSPQG